MFGKGFRMSNSLSAVEKQIAQHTEWSRCYSAPFLGRDLSTAAQTRSCLSDGRRAVFFAPTMHYLRLDTDTRSTTKVALPFHLQQIYGGCKPRDWRQLNLSYLSLR